MVMHEVFDGDDRKQRSLASFRGGAMVRRAYAERSVFEVLLPDADKLWDPTLRQIDAILDDEPLVDLIVEALTRRHPLSARRGRLGTPAAVVLRMLVLKHLYQWSFDECEREVRGSLVYRAFCRIDCERVPDAKTLIRLAHLLNPTLLKAPLDRLTAMARKRRRIRGTRLRVDTTVVETNIHYPTDSSLLADGVRVLTRTMQRIRDRAQRVTLQVRDRTRSVTRRIFEIVQRSRTVSRWRSAARAKAQARMTQLYRELLRIARAAVGDAQRAYGRTRQETACRVERLRDQLRATATAVRRVLAQTRARVIRGDTHYPAK